MSLIADQPRAGGAGTTNEENTGRRAFTDPQTSSSVTGVDLDLITRFSVILRALASGKPVDADKFDLFARETSKQASNANDLAHNNLITIRQCCS